MWSGAGAWCSTRRTRKPDPKKADTAAAQAQSEEVQSLVRLADAAMTGQQAPSDFHDSVSERFPEGAERARVGADHADNRSVEAHDRSADALPAGRASRHDCAPAAPAAPPADAEEERQGQEEGREAARRVAGAYPFEDVSFLDLKPITRSAAAHHARRGRAGRQLRSLRRDARACRGRRPTPKAAVLKQPLDVPNYSTGEFTTSSVLLAERVEQLSAPVTPDQQSERPYAFGQQEVIVSPEHKFKKDQELIVLFQITIRR